MKIFGFSLLVLFFTWLLLIVGGLVNPNGASMACPDWYFFPTCNGEVFPLMTGGVLYEHGHRLLASMVGLLTLILFLCCFFSKKVDGFTKKLSFFALLLVVLQGTFGGITVLLNLSAIVSVVHLLCAMIFFGLLLLITFRLSPNNLKLFSLNNGVQKPLFIAVSLTFLQLFFGGVVRHLGAGMACGDDLLGCGPSIWPSYMLGQLHMLHRGIGYVLFFVVLYASIKSYQKSKSVFSIVPILITLTQVFLGFMAIFTVRNPVILALHTGFGALLLSSLLFLYFSALNIRENLWIKQL